MAENNQHAHPQAAAQMTEAAGKWLASLTQQQKAKATYHYLDGERIFWYYPPLNRHGLPLRDMDSGQRDLAYALMSTGLHQEAHEKAKGIIDHELILGPLEEEEGHVTFVRDPELYYWTVFGEPGGDGPWGWRAEGHHVSLHINCWEDKIISVTPFFLGANPAEVLKGGKQGLRILDRREDLAIELIDSFDDSQKARAIVHDKAPWDILTYNSSKAAVHDNEGVSGSEMTGTQRETLMSIIAEYVSGMRSEYAENKMAELRQRGLDNFRVVWAGALDRSRDHYYRIHGGNFIIEFDNIQNGANHIHSVWRDVKNDFAYDVLRQHLIMYHIV
jgi:hypothetical protein